MPLTKLQVTDTDCYVILAYWSAIITRAHSSQHHPPTVGLGGKKRGVVVKNVDLASLAAVKLETL
jgi:hypothetical protein